MRGHIVKRGKNSYTVVLNMGKDPSTGKRKQQWISVKGNKKDAEKRLSEMLTQIDTGSFMRPGKTTVKDFLERWLADYNRNLSPCSSERYRQIVRTHLVPNLGNIPLAQLKPEHLQNLYTSMQNSGLSANTARYAHSVIHVALKTALKWGLIAKNPADAVTTPRIHRHEMQTWDEGEIGQFLEAAKTTPYYAVFYTALFTGMRQSELLGLKWSDVDLIGSQISVGRGLHHLADGSFVMTEPKSEKSRRNIALTPSNALLLKQHQEKQRLDRGMIGKRWSNEDLVFSTLEGRALIPEVVTQAWRRLAARAGLKVIRFHDARHTHASLWLKLGIHPKIVQERLGHSSIQMTLDIYSHVAPGLQEAAALRFDDMMAPKKENGVVAEVG
jgi:integrase